MTVVISKKFISKLSDIIDAGLCKGLGKPKPGQMCVEAAVMYAKGAEHGDEPTCVHPVVRQFLISLNDLEWSSDHARAQGLKRLAIAQLGTVDNFDAIRFASEMAEYAVKECAFGIKGST